MNIKYTRRKYSYSNTSWEIYRNYCGSLRLNARYSGEVNGEGRYV